MNYAISINLQYISFDTLTKFLAKTAKPLINN